MNREPTLNELIGDEPTGAERQRLQRVHEQLLQTGPPPELSADLEAGPTLGMTLGQRRRKVKRRAMILLAAAIMVTLVFIAGYASGGNGKTGPGPVLTQAFQGTSLARNAQGTLQVWSSQDGYNWPMKLTVVGLAQLPPHSYYDVYLVRNGKPWGLCGTFRVGSSTQNPVTVTLTAPYTLHKGDTWVVTQPGRGGTEPGQTVLRPAPPVTA